MTDNQIENGDKTTADPRLISRVARIVSGVEPTEWKELDRASKQPHLLTARKVINYINRYNEGDTA